MTSPIILRADDGVSWWRDPARLALHLESPDIEAGLYSAWDADGQVLQVLPLHPTVRKPFLGMATLSVTAGRLVETGIYRPDELQEVIREHLTEVLPSMPDDVPDLRAAIKMLCQSQSPGDLS
ncbi:hypothetical protein [Brevifollis gellanilyticus]|uniref:Uncharacterized protein n=1 Tax=Brevifollis gellanilyticus TaxID=748831 RepID=A0A512MH82_9BACT|nr:hypothetical protein [Brevifollis gellanilyticus]GEP46102.1 hypothetical protein BGE01nite_53930 [Brevifollis gellanilyticus]